MELFTGLLFIWILLPFGIFARRNGADIRSCTDMRPMHPGNPQPQTTPAPFTVTLDKTDLMATDQLSITLEAQPGGPVDSFRGFLIQVRRVGGGIPAFGAFEEPHGGPTKVLDCEFGSQYLSNSAITHSINKLKTTVTVKWNPPKKSTPVEYQVYYTVVQKQDTFWVKVVHPQIITVAESEDAEKGGSVSSDLLFKLRQVYRRCGTRKYGCFGVPKACIANFDLTSRSPQLCDMMVTWSKTDQVQNDFAIVAKLVDNEIGGYVALGLSQDNQMGHDSVAACTFPTDGKRPQVRRYYNTKDRRNELYMNGRYGVHAYEIVSIDGHMFCGFTQSDHKIYGEIIDFNNNYFMLLARGTTFTAKGLGVHPRLKDRAVSDIAIRVTDYLIVTSKPEPTALVYLHGSIMLFTWFVVAPTGAFTARYFKLTRVGHLICGKAFWFMAHVFCMLTTCILTFIGATIIFYRKDWIFDDMYYHNCLGLTLNIFLLFQVVLAFLRPTSTETYRTIFKWVHFIVAVFLNCTAISCIFLVSDIRTANIEKKTAAHGRLWNTFSILVVVLQIFMHVLLTYHTYWADGEMKVNENLQFRALTCGPLSSNGVFTEQPGKRFRYLMLLSYIIFSVLTVIVLICLLYI